MKKVFVFGKRVLVAGGAVAASAGAACAEGFTLTPPTIDYTLLGTLAGSILAGLGAIWIIRKVVKMMNRS